MSDEIGVYRIVSPSGKSYVGMTMISFTARWKQHLKELRNGRHKCAGLKRAYAKYGEEALKFEVLEIVPLGTDEAIVLLKEQQWWDKLSSEGIKLYNGRPTGTGSVFHTEESKAKLRQTLREMRPTAKVWQKKCPACDSFFSAKKEYQKCCSRECAVRLRSHASKETIKELYLSGLSSVKIAELTGMKKQNVLSQLKAMGVPRRDWYNRNAN